MVIAAGYYCEVTDVRDLTNLDETALSERKVNKIIGIAQAEIESALKAAGYPTANWTNNATTPPKIQVLCCMLTSGYALQQQYTGESPNESKQGIIWVNHAKKQLRQIAEGKEDLVDASGDLIEPDTEMSGDTLKTTDTKAVFGLDDAKDMGDWIEGDTFVGEDED